jgi:hypothetical protein
MSDKALRDDLGHGFGRLRPRHCLAAGCGQRRRFNVAWIGRRSSSGCSYIEQRRNIGKRQIIYGRASTGGFD